MTSCTRVSLGPRPSAIARIVISRSVIPARRSPAHTGRHPISSERVRSAAFWSGIRMHVFDPLLLVEFDAGFLHFAIRQQPDERFVVQVDDLDAVAPRIAEVAPKPRNQFEPIFLRQLVADLS